MKLPQFSLRALFIFTELAGPLLCAGFLLLLDVVFSGTYLFSIIICPIWFLLSLIRNGNAKTERQIALFRIAIPALTLGIALVNTFLQRTIADINGERIVKACETFHSDNGRYPKTLNELVPQYLPSIPRAKYCMWHGNFYYANEEDGSPILFWIKFVFLSRIYSFDSRGWHDFD